MEAHVLLHYGDKNLAMDLAQNYLKDMDFNVYDDILKLLYNLRRTNGEVSERERKRFFRLL